MISISQPESLLKVTEEASVAISVSPTLVNSILAVNPFKKECE